MEFKLSYLACVLLACCLSCSQSTIPKESVKSLNLKRYMGKWYEIARLNHRFEYNLVGVTTEMTALPDGEIHVVCSGHKGHIKGQLRTTRGHLYQPDPTQPGMLKASFMLGICLYHYVLELDEENYSYALIGNATNEYLWILSRTPALSKPILSHLLNKAEQHGYDTTCLIWVEQEVETETQNFAMQ